jgi:hypothetical protein
MRCWSFVLLHPPKFRLCLPCSRSYIYIHGVLVPECTQRYRRRYCSGHLYLRQATRLEVTRSRLVDSYRHLTFNVASPCICMRQYHGKKNKMIDRVGSGGDSSCSACHRVLRASLTLLLLDSRWVCLHLLCSCAGVDILSERVLCVFAYPVVLNEDTR